MADYIINTKEYYLEKEILAPLAHILQVNCKHIREDIVLAFNYWLKVPDDKLHDIVESTHMIYKGGILIDDVEDNTTIRRGLPAAHCVYGVPLAINAGLHVLQLALGRLIKIHPKGAEIFQRDFLEVIRGQSTEIYWRDNMICPTEEQCLDMLEQKNGSIFRMSISLMQLFSEEKIECDQLAMRIGLYFQLREDYLNIFRQEALNEFPAETSQTNQAFCEDLTEGKFTIPIIHAMGTPQADAVRNILRQRTSDRHLKQYCVELLKKSGSYEYTRNVLKKMDQEIRKMIADLGGNPTLTALLDEFLSTM